MPVFTGIYIKTNQNNKRIDLETEIPEKTCNAMFKSLGANKENKVAVGRITGMKNLKKYFNS